jgi:cytochrome c peroxidase
MKRALAAAALLAAALLSGAAAPTFDWKLPPGVAPPPVPADNPMSEAKVELGRRLFYDADLSVDGTLSCASCHEQHRGFAEGNATRPGVHGTPGRRNVMGLANVGYLTPLTWADPGQATLEAQFSTPVLGDTPIEMGMKGQDAELVRRLSADACYRRMFAAAFPGDREGVTVAKAAKAVAAFQRTLLSWDAPYDRYRRGEGAALSPPALAGLAVFEAKGCPSCHAGPNFTDGRFHAVAAPAGQDRGAVEKTANPADANSFRTASLRNAALTGPYLHDGRALTLGEAIVGHWGAGDGFASGELAALDAFLASLTDTSFVRNRRFALPKRFCGAPRRR